MFRIHPMIVMYIATLFLVVVSPQFAYTQLEEAATVALGNQTAARGKYRTPFIIPISNPYFGNPPGPVPKSTNSLDALTSLPLEHEDVSLAPLPGNYVTGTSRVNLRDTVPSEQLHATYRPIKAARLTTAFERADHRPKSKVVSVVRPNFEVIRERVALHNLTVAAIRDQLANQEEWSISDLDSLSTQLGSIRQAAQLRDLYVALLTDRQKQRIVTELGLSQCLEKLKQRLFETRVALEVNRFAVTTLELPEAHELLDRISDRLERISPGGFAPSDTRD